jgi:hypothetical protein
MEISLLKSKFYLWIFNIFLLFCFRHIRLIFSLHLIKRWAALVTLRSGWFRLVTIVKFCKWICFLFLFRLDDFFPSKVPRRLFVNGQSGHIFFSVWFVIFKWNWTTKLERFLSFVPRRIFLSRISFLYKLVKRIFCCLSLIWHFQNFFSW